MDIVMAAAPGTSSLLPQPGEGNKSFAGFPGEDGHFNTLLEQAVAMLSEEPGCCHHLETPDENIEASAGSASETEQTAEPFTEDVSDMIRSLSDTDDTDMSLPADSKDMEQKGSRADVLVLKEKLSYTELPVQNDIHNPAGVSQTEAAVSGTAQEAGPRGSEDNIDFSETGTASDGAIDQKVGMPQAYPEDRAGESTTEGTEIRPGSPLIRTENKEIADSGDSEKASCGQVYGNSDKAVSVSEQDGADAENTDSSEDVVADTDLPALMTQGETIAGSSETDRTDGVALRIDGAKAETENTKGPGTHDTMSDTSGKQTKAGRDAVPAASPDSDTPDKCCIETTARLGRESSADTQFHEKAGNTIFVRSSAPPDVPQAAVMDSGNKTISVEPVSLVNGEPASMSLAKEIYRLTGFTEQKGMNPPQKSVRSEPSNTVQANLMNTLQDSRIMPEHPQSATHAKMPAYQEIMDAIVYVVRGNRRLGVSLEHESLGKLNISLNMSRGLVNVHINASDGVVRQYIENNLHTMMDALQKEGVSIGGFSVALNEQNSRRREATPFPENTGPLETGTPMKIAVRNNGLINIFI